MTMGPWRLTMASKAASSRWLMNALSSRPSLHPAASRTKMDRRRCSITLLIWVVAIAIPCVRNLLPYLLLHVRGRFHTLFSDFGEGLIIRSAPLPAQRLLPGFLDLVERAPDQPLTRGTGDPQTRFLARLSEFRQREVGKELCQRCEFVRGDFEHEAGRRFA